MEVIGGVGFYLLGFHKITILTTFWFVIGMAWIRTKELRGCGSFYRNATEEKGKNYYVVDT